MGLVELAELIGLAGLAKPFESMETKDRDIRMLLHALFGFFAQLRLRMFFNSSKIQLLCAAVRRTAICVAP